MSITVVEVVVSGPAGPKGPNGDVVHAGGLTKQVLMKQSEVDFDATWNYVTGADTSFTSTEGLVSTNVSSAIDEVEAQRIADATGIDDLQTRGEINTTAGVTSIDDLTTPGLYDVTSSNSLPFGVSAARLTVVTEITGTYLSQVLTDIVDGREYSRTKTGVDAWVTWTERYVTANVTALKAKTLIEDKSGVDIDTIVDPGFYVVDTALPLDAVAGELTVKAYTSSTMIEQSVYLANEGVTYKSYSAIGDGSDWTTFEEVNLAANSTVAMKFADLTQSPPPYIAGQVYYADGTLMVQGDYSDTTLNVGEELLLKVTNITDVDFYDGQIVRFDDIIGGVQAPVLAQADTYANAANVAVMTGTVLRGEFGRATKYGTVRGLNTSSLTLNARLYLSESVPGAVTMVAPDIATFIGFATSIDATNGSIYVAPTGNIALPTIFAGLKVANSPTSLLGNLGVSASIDDYSTASSVVMSTNAVTGELTCVVTGTYRVNIAFDLAFDNVAGAGKKEIYLGVRNTTTDTLIEEIKGFILKDAETYSFSANSLVDLAANSDYALELRSEIALTNLEFTQSNFDLESVHIR